MPLSSVRQRRSAGSFPSPPPPPDARPGRPYGSGEGAGPPGAGRSNGRRPGSEQPPVRRARDGRARRRPRLALAGSLLVVLCAGLGAAVAGRMGERTAYLAVARFVAEGATFSAADFSSVSLTGPAGVTAVPVTESSSVLGRRAAVPLEPGALLAPADVASGPAVPPGSALVGATLAPDQLPPTLSAGDRVLVVLGGSSGTPVAGGQAAPRAASGAGIIALGTVEELAPLPAGGSGALPAAGPAELVTLQVPTGDAAAVAQASAAGQLSLAEVSAAAGA